MSAEVVHVGRRIRVEVDTLTTAGGRTIRRDAIRHPGAVVILPVLDAERVVLLRNFRFVIGETLWEVPAGTVEPPEELEVCAKRELLEETGYRAAKWRSLGYLYASPGVLDEKLHLFVAEELTPGDAQPGTGRATRTGGRAPRRRDSHVPGRHHPRREDDHVAVTVGEVEDEGVARGVTHAVICRSRRGLRRGWGSSAAPA